jgi:hypothetical protein
MSGPDDAAIGRAVARRLLERESDGTLEGEAAAAAMERACTRVFDDLRSAVGADGLEALLLRVVARTQGEHPALASMRRSDGAGMPLDVRAAIKTHGLEAARAGLEAVLAGLVDILTALIGADMTRNLLHDNNS